MFVGHFKIDGHSNPKHKKAFHKRKEALQKRIKSNGQITNSSARKSNFHKSSILSIVLILFVIFLTYSGWQFVQMEFQNYQASTQKKIIFSQKSEELSDQQLWYRAHTFMQNETYRNALDDYVELYKRAIDSEKAVNNMLLCYQNLCKKEGDEIACRKVEEWNLFLNKVKQ